MSVAGKRSHHPVLKPFHLSFVVPDKQESKRFYLETLGCSLGRDNEGWYDIIFFGHQLTIHQATETLPAFKIDHFGAILSKDEWQSVAARCKEHSVRFVLEPMVKNDGADDEYGKFVVNDPSGNALELKYYANFGQTVGKAKA
jgi:extradiol dioxygenase family protein